MNECFDPRSAKNIFGRISGMGTLGGLCGGVLAALNVVTPAHISGAASAASSDSGIWANASTGATMYS